MASTTQLMDVHIRQWSDPLMRAFGLEPDQWPLIAPSGTRRGPVFQAPGVTAVATCSHDTGSAVAAGPATELTEIGPTSAAAPGRSSALLTDDARETCFTHEAGIAGPPKIADIKQSLVIRAHGPRSFTVVLTDRSTDRRAHR